LAVSRRSSAADPALAIEHDLADLRLYWEERHRRSDDLRSGGHIGLDRAGNEIFYARRIGELLEIIGDYASPAAPLSVLDAGCGKGHFATAVARCGHRVDAIDASGAAIEYCREHVGAHARFAVSPLSEWRSPWLYDVVYAIDVLFHILDDGEWAASAENLASLARYGGTLVITDENGPRRTARGSYIVHRTREEYEAVLAPRGLTYRGFRPYAFRDNHVGFHVFTRTR
jgi:2-polyprenyl-3-methyl-5-hydroxy-6-metoxy-1,4-benzoquinol methylase